MTGGRRPPSRPLHRRYSYPPRMARYSKWQQRVVQMLMDAHPAGLTFRDIRRCVGVWWPVLYWWLDSMIESGDVKTGITRRDCNSCRWTPEAGLQSEWCERRTWSPGRVCYPTRLYGLGSSHYEDRTSENAQRVQNP